MDFLVDDLVALIHFWNHGKFDLVVSKWQLFMCKTFWMNSLGDIRKNNLATIYNKF